MSDSPARVVIVGFGAAGLTTAEVLRQQGWTGVLTIISDEHESPYDRPTLSKHYLAGEFDVEKIRLVSEARIASLDARIVEDTRAVSLDAAGRAVTDSRGEVHHYDELVIATGITPSYIPGTRGVEGVHVLRTRDDADGLRQAIVPGEPLLVVGGGFLGLEVAATARLLGADVTVVEPLPIPLGNRIDPRVAQKIVDLHREKGVTILAGLGLASIEKDENGRMAGAVLSDGTVVHATSALIAVGARPDLGWLEGSGLTLGDGIVCDEYCRAVEHVWVAGDVAQWRHLGIDRSIRLEHRMNASDQGRHVARNILGADEPFVPVPFFWTDHFDVRIQSAGTQPLDVEPTVVSGDWDGDSFVIEYRDPSGRLHSVLGWNAVKEMMPLRRELAARPVEVA